MAGRKVLMSVDIRFVRETEGRIAGSKFFIGKGYFVHVGHGAAVTHLRSDHSH